MVSNLKILVIKHFSETRVRWSMQSWKGIYRIISKVRRIEREREREKVAVFVSQDNDDDDNDDDDHDNDNDNDNDDDDDKTN